MFNLILFAIPFVIVMFYLLRNADKTKNIFGFKPVNDSLTFELKFVESKDGTISAKKRFATKQIGCYLFTIYTDKIKQDNNNYQIKVEKAFCKDFKPLFIGHLNMNDLITIFTLMNKL